MKSIVKTKGLYLLYLCAFFLPFFSYSQPTLNASLQGVIRTKSGVTATVQGFLEGDIQFPFPSRSVSGLNFAFKGVCENPNRFELIETTTFFFPGEINPDNLVSISIYILDNNENKDAAVFLGFIRTSENFGSFISIGKVRHAREIQNGPYRLRLTSRNPSYPVNLEGPFVEVERLDDDHHSHRHNRHSCGCDFAPV